MVGGKGGARALTHEEPATALLGMLHQVTSDSTKRLGLVDVQSSALPLCRMTTQ